MQWEWGAREEAAVVQEDTVVVMVCKGIDLIQDITYRIIL